MDPNNKPRGLDRPSTTKIIKVMARSNVWLYRKTGGRLGTHWRVGAAFRKPVKICLVEHTGRKTGQARVTPLVFLRDQDRIVVVASQAGLPQHPQWYRNLMADPRGHVQIDRDRWPILAREADPVERAELWPRLVDLYSDYDTYQAWTDREIPV
ncbi:MAG TPA: nitroreductase family deazaflavin-dependent oxidoreductase, partial [Marmoricola sp.]|nr:nitroreductase family deazaflavin-dependent oxidoreductase [Marmoricola sp.]